MLLSAEAHSTLDVLPTLLVPLLIMAGGRDQFAPLARVGALMHEAARRSEMVLLDDATHTALLDHSDQIGDAVDRFLARHGLIS
jgi:pimeloyl-ACP methyl ester carboxylesterase